MQEITKQGSLPGTGTACALGLFDGVHRGHRVVIDKAVALEALGLKSAVFTFKTDTVTSKGHDGRIEMILTDEEKRRHFDALGIDYIYSPKFSELRDMSGEAFVRDILKGRLRCEYAVCGSDFHFGRGAAEDCHSLQLLGKKYGIEIIVCDKLTFEGEEVSSTAIREYIRSGRIEKANKLLGYTFGLRLTVEHGREIGRTWSFPTINQIIPAGQLLPKFGVYCTRVIFDGSTHYGVTNVGVKPTLKLHDAPLAETFILDYSGDLYGREVEILLDSFVRPERGFDSIDSLREQIAADTAKTREYYGV